MKLSFSTNGWRDTSWQSFCDTALDMGYQGIELHDIDDEAFSGRTAPFNPAFINQTARRLQDLRIAIPCVDTCVNIADGGAAEKNLSAITDAIYLAKAVRCPFVRIYAFSVNGKTPEEEDDASAALLSGLIPAAEKSGVSLLIETSGIYADTLRLKNLLDRFACDNLAALWDINHPYRVFGEEPDVTVTNLGAYIRHVHMKDSAVRSGKQEYCLMGEGSLPIPEVMNSLNSINYEGFLSIEWNPETMGDEYDEGIVFTQYVNYMSRYERKRITGSYLYSNKAGTGKYVWEKDKLITNTFPQVLDRMVAEFPDQPAFRYTTLDYTRTYSEFRRDVDTFCRVLISLGVRRGDHVAVWATNVPQWYISFWAATKIGCVLVSVNTAYKIHEAEYLFHQSDTHTLIMTESNKDSNYREIMNELCPEIAVNTPGEPLHAKKLPFLRNIITVGFKMPGCLTWDEAMERADRVPVEEVYRRAALVEPGDVCNMQYTSGTTGFPKGVMLTHYNIVNNGKCIGDRMDLSTADRMMIQVPMFHCFGMVLAMTASMTHGATLCPLPYFSAKQALNCINQEHITCFHGVPTMFIAMLEHPDFDKTDFSFMRTGIMAGSPCPVPTMQAVMTKMRMSEITIVYGQTEASPGCTMSSTDDPIEVRVGTVGRAMPGIECKIVDPDTGEEMPDGQNGEFVARGYNIMKGYYKMPHATSAAIDKDGWLHTGDLACRLPDGNYKITGRLKDMIIRGGENVYPKEIEEFLLTHPDVRDVQVIGVPDEQYGEEIMACIIMKDGRTSTEAEMKQFVADHMARHKVPRYIDFVDEFPMNVAGKILKYKMREAAVERLKLRKDAAGIELPK